MQEFSVIKLNVVHRLWLSLTRQKRTKTKHLQSLQQFTSANDVLRLCTKTYGPCCIQNIASGTPPLVKMKQKINISHKTLKCGE